MIQIYVAGPYRGPHGAAINANIQQAWGFAAALVQRFASRGVSPVVPHLNTQHMDGLASAEFFLAATMDLLLRCDAMIVQGQWRASQGTLGEIAAAKRAGMPVFFSIAELQAWLDSPPEVTGLPACPACGGKMVMRRAKLVCAAGNGAGGCGRIAEGCCEGARCG